MNYNIALLKGDGIGPEIVDSAVAVLQKIGEKFHHTFTCTPYLIGGCAIDATGVPLPKETVDGCLASDSVLLGAVGGAVGHSKWDVPTAARTWSLSWRTAASASGKGSARHSGGSGTVYQPASGKTLSCSEGRLPAAGRYCCQGL